MVLADSVAVASAPIFLTTALSIASFVTLVTLVALCACCKCCHRPLKEEDLEAYGVNVSDGHAPVVQFRDGKGKQARYSSERMPKSALKKTSRSESAPADSSTTLLHSASTRRALPSLPSELKPSSSPTRDSSTSDLYATVDKQASSVVAVVHDWKSETDSKTTRTTVARTSVHRLKRGEQQQLVDEQPSYARIPPRNVTYDTIDAESDLTDPLYSKVDAVDSRPFRYEYPAFATKAQTQLSKRGEHLYQRVDDDGSQIYAGGSEDPYSSIPSDVGGGKRLRTIEDDDDDDVDGDDDDESSAYDPGYARVTTIKPKESSVDDAPGPSSSRPVPTRNVDHLYTKINRHSAPVCDNFSSDRRAPSPPPPLPDNRDRRPRSEQPNEEAIREPSYRYITVRESLDVLRARMANQQREQSEQLLQQTAPVAREHYYATIGSEHGYEVVPNRPPHQQPLYEDVLNSGPTDGDVHRYDMVYPPASPENTLTSTHRGDDDSGASTPRRLSIPPPIPPTSPIPERTPPKTEPSSRMYSRSTTGDFTTASEESRRADSFCSIERDDLPPKRPNDPLVRGMAAVGQGAGELIDRGLSLIARSVSNSTALADPAPSTTYNGTMRAEMTAAGGADFDSSLELSGSPLPTDRSEAGEAGTAQGMPQAQQRYPSATSYQNPVSSLNTASAPLAPIGHNASHPRSSQVTSSASPSSFADRFERSAADQQQQQQLRATTASSSDNGGDTYNRRRPAPEALYPENAPFDGSKKRLLVREDSDQSFVTAPTSANDVLNGGNANGGGHFELNGSAAPTTRSYREMISKQSSEESSDQETEEAFTARRRDWSQLSGGGRSESKEEIKSDRRLREALRTRTGSQESSSGVSGSLDAETKLDDNRTLSRELIDDGTLHADGGRSSANGRRSAASAASVNSDNMHDSGMFVTSFSHPDTLNSPQHPDAPPNRQHPTESGVKYSSSAHSLLPQAVSPDSHSSKIPLLASKIKRQNSPIDTADSTHPAHTPRVGFRAVYDDDDEHGFNSSKNIPADAGARSASDYSSSTSNTVADRNRSSIKPPSSLGNLDSSNTALNVNKSGKLEQSGSVASSSRLNFRPVFDESPISPESFLSSQDTDSEAYSNTASSTFATSAANAANVSLAQRSPTDQRRAIAQRSPTAQRSATAAIGAYGREGAMTPRGRPAPPPHSDDFYRGATAQAQGGALQTPRTGPSASLSESRSRTNDEQRRGVGDAKRSPTTAEALSVDVTMSPRAGRKVEKRDYMEKRAEAGDMGDCDGTCYCHSAMAVPERVWDENLYEMDKIRWGANRKSSSEESTKGYDARLL
uniref:Uncharacterized protein n=1 Tax=Plectus sambesii TaxID=2011161 RepID=A0A914UI84_9BILA